MPVQRHAEVDTHELDTHEATPSHIPARHITSRLGQGAAHDRQRRAHMEAVVIDPGMPGAVAEEAGAPSQQDAARVRVLACHPVPPLHTFLQGLHPTPTPVYSTPSLLHASHLPATG